MRCLLSFSHFRVSRPPARTVVRRAVTAVAAWFVGLLLVGGPTPSLRAAGEDVAVGVVVALTGNQATFGTNSRDGMQLAVDEVNGGGGVLNGRKLRLVFEDTQTRPGQTAAIANKLINNDRVAAIIGDYTSSSTLEAAPICQAAKVPLISHGATNPAVTEKGDFVFRVCFIDPFQGTVNAKFALESLHLKKAAILTAVNQDYSVGLAQFFKEYFLAHGGQVVAERSYSTGDRDFRAQLTALKAANPDFLFVPGYYTEVGLIARQARSLGVRAPLLGGDGWDSPQLLEIGGAALDGAYFSNHYSPEQNVPAAQEFLQKYQAKYHAKPGAPAALGYDAVKLLADAFQRAGKTDGPALRDALASTKNFVGVTGSITIDDKRNANKPAVILQVKGKEIKYVTSVEP